MNKIEELQKQIEIEKDKARCSARLIDKSYAIDARCELSINHTGQHKSVISHGHTEMWDGDLLDRAPDDYEMKKKNNEIVSLRWCITNAQKNIADWQEELDLLISKQ
jgi:hypothetical protein